MKRTILFSIICIFILASLSSRDIPASQYTYNSEKKDIYSPDVYSFCDVIYPATEESSYTDIFNYEGELYFLDAGTDCVRTSSGKVIEFLNADGDFYDFVEPRGLFIDENNYYIADRGNSKVVVFDKNTLSSVLIIENPDTSKLGIFQPFAPSSVLVDKVGNIYVLVDDLYYGAFIFSSSGEFCGYYGANPTELTFSQRLDQGWKRILNREQRSAMERFVPVAYTGFDIDENGFIYTVSSNITDEKMKIRKINPSGIGLWDDRKFLFGDIIPDDEYVEGLGNSTRFIDIDVNGNFFYALDSARSRVFCYDNDGHLLCVFGSKGRQWGAFVDALRIESDDRYVYVLDASDSTITCFDRTYYGENLYTAVSLFSEGFYQEAFLYWKEVERINPDLEIAHLGLGKAYLKEGNNKSALRQLRLSGDRVQYSLAFERIRLLWARENLVFVFVVLSLVFVVWRLISKRKRFSVLPKSFKRHLQILVHPSDLMWETKRKKQFSYIFSTELVLIYFVVDILVYFSTGYIFNRNIAADFNILLSFMNTAGLFFLWSIVNWAVSTISDGNGTFKDVYCGSSYALIPLIAAKLINLCLSHILVLDEAVFITWISAAAMLWAIIVLLITVSTIHEYSLGRTLFNVFMTVLGIVFILFLIFLFVVLFENMANIFSIIFNEITLRR